MKMKVKKVESLNERSKMNIQEGKVYEGTVVALPVVGNYFWCGGIRTSTVLEIIDNYHFRTENSIYHFEVVKDDKANTVPAGGLGESISTGGDLPKESGDGGRVMGRGVQEEIENFFKGTPFRVNI